jgi:glycosyltransferase involved in cell wall biosynthesis
MVKNQSSSKTIIMACTQPYWSSLQVGSQHIARQFANNGWRVYYFSSPITFLHLFKIHSHEIRRRLQFSIRGQKSHYNKSIYSNIPFSLIAPSGLPFFRSRKLIYEWYKTLIPPIKLQFKKKSIEKVQLLYIDNIFFHFFINIVNCQKSIFRIMDEHHRFPGWNNNAKILAMDIARKCNALIYSAKGLEPYVSMLKPESSLFIPNGVDLSLFKNFKETKKNKRHYLLKKIQDPIIIYSGMIDSRIDFQLLQETAIKNPNIYFVLAGPIENGIKSKYYPNNIIFIGPVPHNELPWLMDSAKAGIIPFDAKNKMERLRGIRPLKLFEYMAAGIPVITSRWPEIEMLDSPAWIYDSKDEFIQLVQRAVKYTPNQKIYTKFAEKHDWKNSFDTLLNYIDKI